MSNNKNPRPEFMSRLKSLCKNLDKKTLELEQETSVPYTRSVKGPYASNFADALLDNTKKLGHDIDQTSQLIKEEADNLESFLETTMAQVQDHLEEVGRMETYMASYGYKPLPPLAPEVLDWRTPPAAADLPPTPSKERNNDGVEIGTPDKKENPANDKEDTPNIFDLGLSKQTLEIVVGKSVKSKSSAEELRRATTDETNDISQDGTIDMMETINASPILRLTSRLKECNTSLDASSSYTVASNTDTDTSQVEITPGLTVRRPGSSLRNRQSKPTTPNEPSLSLATTTPNEPSLSLATTTPNEPTLSLATTTPSEPSLSLATTTPNEPSLSLATTTPNEPSLSLATTTPNEPSLSLASLDKESSRVTTPNEPSLTTQPKTSGSKTTTPSEPNLTTQVKKLSPLGTPTTPTTTAQIEFSTDGTPVMPTLKTVNINTFNLAKTVSEEKREEPVIPAGDSLKPIGECEVKAMDLEATTVATSKLLPASALVGKSFPPKTPMQLLRKEVSADTPETPDLMTRDIRKLISQAMGLKQSREAVEQTTPTDPELIVSRSIPECVGSKELASSSRSTPEEPSLRGALLSTSRIVHEVQGLEDTPELPELSIMADRTTAREDTLTPNTPIFSNHTLGRFPK